jgi:periplasmic divalent cation tolerance protein
MTEPWFQIVFMTAPNSDEAERIATALVEANLAACVNIVPSCRSVYRWKGEIVKDNEVMLFAKTKRADFEKVAREVTGLHSYEVPEIIAVDMESISESYLRFLREVLES